MNFLGNLLVPFAVDHDLLNDYVHNDVSDDGVYDDVCNCDDGAYNCVYDADDCDVDNDDGDDDYDHCTHHSSQFDLKHCTNLDH